jgi:hypothetical protein
MSPASCRLAMLAILLALPLAACGTPGRDVEVSRRELALDAVPDSLERPCAALPDTLVEIRAATIDRGDFPEARIRLAPECAVASVGFVGLARIPRAYHVQVPAGRTLVARARGEDAGVVLHFDELPQPDTTGAVSRTAVDSLHVDRAREVAVRVMLVPQLRTEPRQSRVLLSVVVR